MPGPGNDPRICLSLATLHFGVNAGSEGFPLADAQPQLSPHVVNGRLLKTATQFPLLKSYSNMAIGSPSSLCDSIPIVFRPEVEHGDQERLRHTGEFT